MGTCLYVAEGEIEKRFLTEIKQLEYFVPGKFMKYNLMHNRIKYSDSIMAKKYSRIICVIDTDCLDPIQLKTLEHNLRMLSEVCRNIEVMVQNKNFEDELCRLLGKKSLLKVFSKTFDGVKDLKRFLAQNVIYKEYLSTEKLEAYCGKYHEFRDLWIKQHKRSAYIKFVTGKDIMNKK